MKLLGNLLRKSVGTEVTSPVTSARARDNWAVKDEPTLVLLVPDAAGRASYHLNTFKSTAAAVSFFKFWTLDSGSANCIAFWALLYPPVNTGDAEPIVLVREPASTTRVYPFSFSAMDDALDFVRRETENGLQLSDAIVYWAARVEVRQTEFDVRMSPAYAPEVRLPGLRGLVFELPTVFVQKAVSEDHEPTATVESAAPAAKSLRAKKSQAHQSHDRRKVSRKDHEDVVPPEVIEAAIKTLTDKARKANGKHPPEEAVVIELAADPQAEAESKAEESSAATFTEGQNPAPQKLDDQDDGWMVTEMERFQARRRWGQDAPGGPFRGFDSPRGRF